MKINTKKGLVLFWEQEEGGSVHRLVGTVPAELAEAVRALIHERAAFADAGSRAEPVCVIAVDEEEFARERSLNRSIQTVEDGQMFPSAVHASEAMGYKTNDVATRLSKARADSERDAAAKFGDSAKTMRFRPSVKLRGVMFQYERDLPG
jgi:hypothetical protein